MTKTLTTKLLLLSSAMSVTLLFSCQKSNNEDLQALDLNKDSRAVFKTTNEFIAAANRINSMKDEEVIAWESQNNKNSLRYVLASAPADHEYSEAENELMKFPKSHLSLLNKDSEVQVGDSIVWYNKGNKYYVHKEQESELAKIKQDEQYAKTFIRQTYSTRVQPLNKRTDHRISKVTMGLNVLNAKYQREFTQVSPSSGCRKYVNEIWTYGESYYANDPFCGAFNSWYTTATLYIKLEWKNCSRSTWNPAGESREISYNLTRDVKLRNVVMPCTTSEVTNLTAYGTISDSQIRSSELGVLLYSWSGNSKYTPYYEIELSGNIYQHIVGDIQSNEWNLIGYPLW